MADFKVQRGQTSIPGGSTTATLTAGTDYTAPASATAAFIRITNVYPAGGGLTGLFDELAEDWTVFVQNPANITTSIILARATIGTQKNSPFAEVETVVEWEIIEYIGPVGGGNEFIVRLAETIAVGAAATQGDSAAVAGVVTDADVVVVVTGVKSPNTEDATGYGDEINFTAEWVAASDVARVTRGGSGAAADLSIAVVEFTGANWSVQRVEHAYTASGTIETETIAAVGSLAKAFTHAQLRHGPAASNLDESGHEVWLSAVNTLSFQLQSGAGIDSHTAVVWIVENTQSGGTKDMAVQRVAGSRADNAGPTADVWTETITAVADLATSSIMGESCRSTGTGNANDRLSMNVRLTATTTVTLRTADGGNIQTYRFEVVEWPEASAVAGETGSINEGLSLGDGFAAQVDTAASISEGLVLGDTFQGATGEQKSVSEGLVLGDSFAAQVDTAAAITEGIELGFQTALEATLDFPDDGLVLGDSFAAQVDAAGSISEGLVLGDAWIGDEPASANRATTDGVLFGDAFEAVVQATPDFSEGLELGDSFARRADVAASIAEGLRLGDAWIGVGPDTIDIPARNVWTAPAAPRTWTDRAKNRTWEA